MGKKIGTSGPGIVNSCYDAPSGLFEILIKMSDENGQPENENVTEHLFLFHEKFQSPK